MSEKQHCPHCGAGYLVPPGMGAKKLLCRHCKGRIELPASQPVDDFEVVEEEIDDQVEVVEDDPAPSREGKSSLRPLSESSRRSAMDALSRMGKSPAPQPPSPSESGSSESRPRSSRPGDPRTGESRSGEPRPKKKKSKKSSEPIIDPGLLKISLGVGGALLAFGAVIWLLSGLFRSGPDLIPEEQWREIEVANRYKAKLPGPAQMQTQNMGPVRMNIQTFSPDKDSAYMIGHMEGSLPAERMALPVEQLLDDSCNGSLQFAKQMDPDSKELSRTTIKLGEHIGKELVIYIPAGKGRSIARYYLIHGRLYIVMALGKGLRETNENVLKMFNSFVPTEIPEAPAPPKPPLDPEPDQPGSAIGFSPPPSNPGIPAKNPGGFGGPKMPENNSGKSPIPVMPEGFKLAFELEIPKVNGEFAAGVLNLGFSRDGKTLAVATAAERVHWFDVDSRKQVETRRIASPPGVNGAAISAEADRVAFHKHGGLLYLWEKGEKTETVLSTDEGGGITQYQAAFSPDGNTLAIGNGFAFVRLWDLKTRKKITEMKPFSTQVAALVYSPDGSLLACSDTEASIWNPKTHKKLITLEPKGQFYTNWMAFSPDGKSLFGVSDRTVMKWSLTIDATGEKITADGTPHQNIERISNIRLSPDGKYLAGLVDGGRVRIWDANTMKRQGDLNLLQRGSGSGLAFHPVNGKLAIATSSAILFVDLAEQKWD